MLDEETVDVVLFRGDQGAAMLVDGDTVVDLNSPAPLAREVCLELVDSTIQLLASADVPREVVDLLRQAPVPPAFNTTPWLRHHRAVILSDDRFALGAFVLTYDSDLGLCVQEDGDR
ncbi:hypothetical protein [Amycolatopsis taiwanensis]|uniref:hypothetical protein n=1 Tax=Amycolatopsis taiwanensis TaxID=342230 RepID=UPI0004B152C1|nr:hypothetical protein [Amycolatopsis taiwanensis]